MEIVREVTLTNGTERITARVVRFDDGRLCLQERENQEEYTVLEDETDTAIQDVLIGDWRIADA